MEIKLAVLADYAAITDQGKLVLGGVFDTLILSRLPGVHPQMAVAVRMSASTGEGTKHALTLRLVDPEGADVVPPIEGALEFRSAGTLPGAGAQVVLHLNQIEFRAEGAYRFEILVDGHPIGSIDLSVHLTAPQTPRH
ncbi:MAG: hypothetical protein C0418_02290 [Coriobacteriaceae bacterium]|nr:hypothetical protein [Coriobacteriaceae bacterium]